MPVDWSDNVCVAHLADDPAFSDELDEVERRLEEHPRHCVLDLAGVTFLNSSNLAQLVGLRKQLTTTDCRLALCNVADTIWEAISVSRLDRLFERHESVAMALAVVQLEEAT